MKEENNKWIEDVFQSMNGSRKANVNPALFAKIEDRILASEVAIIPAFGWKQFAAAAAIILALNTITMINYNKSIKSNDQDIAAIESNNQTLISTYQIYN